MNPKLRKAITRNVTAMATLCAVMGIDPQKVLTQTDEAGEEATPNYDPVLPGVAPNGTPIEVELGLGWPQYQEPDLPRDPIVDAISYNV